MLSNGFNNEVVFICMLLTIGGNVALARVNNNWHKNTVAQNRPVRAGYHQPNQTQWLRNNRTQGLPAVNLPQNNRMQNHQPVYKPAAQNSQLPTYGQGTFNQTRSSWQQPKVHNQAQYPSYGQHGFYNQSHPSWSQHPSNGQQNYFNQTRPSWPQPSAPQLPRYPSQPNNRPVLPLNQTNLYPKLPSLNFPQAPLATGNGLAAQPLQGPHNWHTNGPAILSYGPGYNPSLSGNSNKSRTPIQGSNNPYANIFN